MDIKRGDILIGDRWPEPIKIDLIEKEGNYVRIIGAYVKSNRRIDQTLDYSELNSLKIIESNLTFSCEPWKLFLTLEAKRYRYASLYDPLLAMNISKIAPLPHQIEAVYGYVLKQPRIRFLIADDPGAGKTIMAGLIIKELKLRNVGKRILIVTPGHLKDQWRRELKEKFNERFIVVDRNILDAHYAENVWSRENQIITSIDFAKRDDIAPSIAATSFDLTIVDEAHKMSAYMYSDKVDRTGRYKLGEILSEKSEHLLFLTATPHKGDKENFRLFLDLLQPGFFANQELLEESLKRRDNPLFIRRMKEDLKDFDGKPIFTEREVRTISLSHGKESPNELELYNNLSNYIINQHKRAMEDRKRHSYAFALVIFQRRLASSVYALLKSLERRKEKLKINLELLDSNKNQNNSSDVSYDLDELEDLSEEERWEIEEKYEYASFSYSQKEIDREIEIIDNLIRESKKIVESESELKLRKLKEYIEKINSEFPNEKLLIFTEFRETLEYLEKKILDWGYSVTTIHGGMRLDDRVLQESTFKNEKQILIATEAAGEGINLQFCHLMINYDIPWNPNRLEQRMGRIHRYGQNKKVYVFNFVAKDTREGAILKKIFDKLEEIRKIFGDRVFDTIGEIYYGINIAQIIKEVAAGVRTYDDAIKTMEFKPDKEYISRVKENLGESLATHFIDYTAIKEMQDIAKEQRLIPEYTEAFFTKAFTKAEGIIKTNEKRFVSIDSVPNAIWEIGNEEEFKKTYGFLLRKYPKITFDNAVARANSELEFISLGHPLFEAVLKWSGDYYDEILKGAIFTDPSGILDGYLLFYEGEIQDGKGEIAGKRLFTFYSDGKKISKMAPSIMWDLIEGGNPENIMFDLESIKKETTNVCRESLTIYKDEILKERMRQKEIKERYGLTSLLYLIKELDGDIIRLEKRKERGEDVEIALWNKRNKKSQYEKSYACLKDEIVKETTLTLGTPQPVGIVRVVPSKDNEMFQDPKVEMIGMRIAMEYERRKGRIPEDVSKETELGFDIRSRDQNGFVRYIEVKARAQEGCVSISQNEWFKAKRFKNDYYLYAVMNAKNEPQLYIVQNPAENLKAKEMYKVTYLIDYPQIHQKCEKND